MHYSPVCSFLGTISMQITHKHLTKSYTIFASLHVSVKLNQAVATAYDIIFLLC